MRKFVTKYFPILSTGLIEYGCLGQIYRMWTQHSARGQNFTSWVMVHIALWLWYTWYRVVTPKDKIPQYVTLFSLFTTAIAAYSTWKFQH